MTTAITTATDLVAALGGPLAIAAVLPVSPATVARWHKGIEPIQTGWHYRLHLMALKRGLTVYPLAFDIPANWPE